VAVDAPVTSPARNGDPDWMVQELVAVQAYQFEPAGALLLKNASPIPHVAGSAVPDLNGLVAVAAVKSTLLLCVRRSTRVWALATHADRAAARMAFRYRIESESSPVRVSSSDLAGGRQGKRDVLSK